MKSIKLKARAKINLSIDIKGIMEDGYHDVEMVMQSINLSDYLLLRKTTEGFKMTCSNSDIPLDKKNIIYKTWDFMKEKYGFEGGIDVFLEKNIPIAAGMAGGSADSAAMFVGLNKLFNLRLSEKELIEDSKALGSDIAFCIKGGTYLATGRGTDLHKLPALDKNIKILVCKPNAFISTKRVYKRFDTMYAKSESLNRPDNKALIEALEDGNSKVLTESMGNVLEPVTRTWCSDIAKIQNTMKKHGAFVTMMSGSGPTVFGFFDNYKSIKRCSSILRKRFNQTFITSASKKGVEICGYKQSNNR